MAGNLERVGVILVAEDVGGFMRTLTGADRSIAGFADGAANAGRRFESAFGQVVVGALREVGATVTRVMASSLASIGGGFVDLAKSGLSMNNSMEIVGAQLMAFTKDAGKTAEILDMVRDRAAKTPFEFNEMAKAATSLLPASKVAGVGLESLMEKAEILAASNPSEGLEGAAFALKEAVGGDFLSLIERFNLPKQFINDLKAQGVPNLEIVRQAMLQLGLDTDLVANLANTASGRWSTFKDSIQGLAATVTAPIFDVFSGGLAKVNDWIVANQPLIDTFAANLATGVGGAVERVSGALQGVLSWLGNAQAAFGLWEKGVISTRTALDTLIPGLGDRLGPAIDKVLGLVRIAAPAFQNLLAAFQTGGFAAIVTVFEDGTSALSSFLEKLGLSESVAIGVSNAVGTVISSFEKGGVVSQALGGYVDTLKERWNVLFGAVTNVANGVAAVVMPVFGLVQKFLAEHGDEIVTVVSNAWEKINSIVNKTIQIVGLVVGAGLTTIGGFLERHGDKIYRVVETSWNLIASVVTTTLNLIEGVVTMVLSALEGDWGKAHDALFNTSTDFVLNLGNVITKGLDFIASFFGTSLSEIGQTWSNNWNMLVSIATKVVDRVKDVGSKIVNAIKSGFENAWSDFIASAQGKLQEFRDMLPFSEPKNPGSPLYGLSKSGEAIVGMLAKGMSDNTVALLTSARDLGAQLIAQFGDDGKKAAEKLTSSMRDALDFRASIPRALDQMDTFLQGVGERLRQTGMYSNVTEDVQRQVQQALGQAQTLDPRAAAQFFKLRTDQIKEMTALQEQLFTATDAERGGLATRIARIFEAQKLELQSFLSQIEGGGGIVSPPATLGQLLTGSNVVTYDNSRTISYNPSYSGGPGSPTYDYAVMQALAV